MRCPLRFIGFMTQGREAFQDDCIEEECAWWYDGGGTCAFLAIRVELENIECNMQELWERMEKRQEG